MRLVPVPSENLEENWHLVYHWIKQATDASPHYAPADIYDAVRVKDMSLWALSIEDQIVGVFAAEVVIYPQVKVGRIVLMACATNYMDEWLALRGDVENWARACGCELMEACGRPGWSKFLPDVKRYALLTWRI